jgi:two-component system, OmpR family, sensor kinase
VRTGLRRAPLLVRLISGFSAAMFVVLLAAGGFVYWRVLYALDRELDNELHQATSALAPLVGPDGRITDQSAVASAGVTYQVLDAGGVPLSGNTPAPGHPLITLSQAQETRQRAVVHVEIGELFPATRHSLRLEVTQLSDGSYLVVGVRRDARDEALRELLLQLVIAGLGALAVTAVVGGALARAALTPVERFRSQAAEIAAGASGLRLEVPLERDDEVTRLGHTLNQMLAELETALEHERRFVNDASHELRTPLTLLSSRVQLARRRARTVAEHEQVLGDLEVDIRRLTELAEHLLLLGSDQPPGQADVVAVAQSQVERRVLSTGTVTVSLEAPPEALPVAVSRTRIERLLDNLLENAERHGAGGTEIAVDSLDGWVRIRVVDNGPGMDPAMLATATQRFSRAPEARSRSGSGLGLSLVSATVTGAGGELRLCSGDEHTSFGPQVPWPCDHDGRMTVTALLPLAVRD